MDFSWRRRYRRYGRTNAVDDRIVRAVEHDLHLLHRSESNFSILGATGNVYTVRLSTTPSCTCPDLIRPCKHILFVLIRVLGVYAEDESIRGTTLRQSLVSCLLGTPTLPEALARKDVRKTFHALSSEAKNKKRPRSEAEVEIPEGTVCPVCLDEMEKGDKAVACEKCKNLLHEECFSKWKRSRGSNAVTCVICRARWTSEEDKYVYLDAYVREESGDEDSEDSMFGDDDDGYSDSDSDDERRGK
ncbi:hypothetical protein HS088_TW09G00538 [Tripterygium wilfordii]|uniref:Mitogen-activated protein kinase kinase kinase 1 n=1 Tax=Tripterygium wilfordii TaxID=458696 RepID=A0A7J7D8A9_TRIWF|nr:mitogen-activated protein kinase kinase kinase 1-like [Tripterygium wilfordii]KAF5742489.1 hypothetical protein HS088_TW09G00538 [Tripterygium wilfordii]